MRFGEGFQPRHVQANGWTIEEYRPKIELQIDGHRVAALKNPACFGLERNAAMPRGMTRERYQPDLRLNPWQADGIKIVPAFALPLMELPAWPVGKVRFVIGNFQNLARVMPGFILAPEKMHLCLREIRQAPGMVKMEVCQNDMAHILGFISQPRKLARNSYFGIPDRMHDFHKVAHHARGILVIVETQASIHKQETLVRLSQQADCSNALIGRPGKGFGKAVEQMDGHGNI